MNDDNPHIGSSFEDFLQEEGIAEEVNAAAKDSLGLDFANLPPDEFKMEFIDLPDGGCEVRFDITGRTRELVKMQAARHGMTLDQWLEYCLRRDFTN